ncbi:MAG TPA: energy transducer TonB [Bacteroidales bacterium]|nr:energy transducer TonB [Bacteroidales bacterium]
MELKKSEKADLEGKKTVFLQLGLIVALAITLVAFEYRSYDKLEVSGFGDSKFVDVPEEMVQITQQQNTPPPPAPPATTTVINIVNNDAIVDDDFKIDAEADDNTQMEDYVAPKVTTQVVEEEVSEVEIFTVVEEAPSYPGGDEARIKFLQENIKYPQMARESGIAGTVYVTFVVERDGSVTDVKVMRGIGGGCDEEAIRVIKAMPKWNPGKQRSKPVRVQFNMPIKFTLAG